MHRINANVLEQNAWHVKCWQIILENLRNAGWNCGSMATTDGKGRPIWVVAAEREDAVALLCMQIKSCLPFSNSNPQFKSTGIIMSAIAPNRMKNWEVIADNLSKAGWSWSCVSAVDGEFPAVQREPGADWALRILSQVKTTEEIPK
jgi:hypothetical protein